MFFDYICAICDAMIADKKLITSMWIGNHNITKYIQSIELKCIINSRFLFLYIYSPCDIYQHSCIYLTFIKEYNASFEMKQIKYNWVFSLLKIVVLSMYWPWLVRCFTEILKILSLENFLKILRHLQLKLVVFVTGKLCGLKSSLSVIPYN